MVALGGGDAFGEPGGLRGLVVAVVASQSGGQLVELADPGAQPVAEHPQRVGCATEGVAAGGAVGVVVDGVEQPGYAGTVGPPLVQQGTGTPGRDPAVS